MKKRKAKLPIHHKRLQDLPFDCKDFYDFITTKEAKRFLLTGLACKSALSYMDLVYLEKNIYNPDFGSVYVRVLISKLYSYANLNQVELFIY